MVGPTWRDSNLQRLGQGGHRYHRSKCPWQCSIIWIFRWQMTPNWKTSSISYHCHEMFFFSLSHPWKKTFYSKFQTITFVGTSLEVVSPGGIQVWFAFSDSSMCVVYVHFLRKLATLLAFSSPSHLSLLVLICALSPNQNPIFTHWSMASPATEGPEFDTAYHLRSG